ncbi:hypothetical protein PR001_g3934 [Phytophthora rubi]|uniref:RxLR effector protein n=1 Tax=Phytophthora rubi TaxID=129364 RepID=A0A6A3P366_9STRA|nr:hypothetical protein PR001_g3934 [Phytophthora rubi]
MLTPIDELLAKLSTAEAVKLANLNKFDDDILAKIKTTKGAAARISQWSKEEFTPTAIANLLKKYPSISRDGSEWSAWKLYAAQYLRKANFLKPTLYEVGPSFTMKLSSTGSSFCNFWNEVGCSRASTAEVLKRHRTPRGSFCTDTQ